MFQLTYPDLVGKQSGSSSPFQTSISCNLQRCIIDSAQDKPANPFFKKSMKAYSIFFNLHTWVPQFPFEIPHRSIQSYWARMTWIVFQLFRLFLLIVGKLLCLVVLCLISARRDKVCPQYRVRNWHATNTLLAVQNPYEHVEHTCLIFSQFCFSKNDEELAELSSTSIPAYLG